MVVGEEKMTRRKSLQGYLPRDLESRKRELEWALLLGTPLCFSHVQHMIKGKSPCPHRKIICCKDCNSRCSEKDRCVGHTRPSTCSDTLREILEDLGKDKTLERIKNMLFGEEK